MPVTRKLIAQALEVVGVERETISDVEVALSEACSNVLRHTRAGDIYEVRAGFDEHRAFLEILDQGPGLGEHSEFTAPADDSESGRGLTLMKALMDSVRFESRRGDGHSVILEKRLTFRPGAPVEKLRSPAKADDPDGKGADPPTPTA